MINSRPLALPRLSALLLAAAVVSPAALAFEVGPFTVTGFVKAEASIATNQCKNCQLFPGEDRQRLWADDLNPNRTVGTEGSNIVLFQPWIAYSQELGMGFKFDALLSQRWRDGKVDIPGSWYERNIALSHEEWGGLRIGAMTSRAWSIADYPYGSDIGVADAWASSGAGYGLLTQAVRYTTRPIDVMAGDLVLEATYDQGSNKFKKNKAQLLEVWAQYRRGDLALDLVTQTSRNGRPSSWGHAPFTSLTPNTADDDKLGGSGQSIAMLMARYDLNNQWQVSGGVRHNRWSGAYAVLTEFRPDGSLWNDMFNVHWNGTLNGVPNPGYPARSTDFSLGARYKSGDMTYSAGYVHLGKAKTANPLERGQSNSLNLFAVGVGKNLGNGWQVYGFAGAVRYGRLGLAPLSMPSNAAFSGVDPRVSRSNVSAGVGATYTF